MRSNIVLTLLAILLLANCVPQQKFLDLEREKNNLEQEVAELDSIANSRERDGNDLIEMNSELARAYREIEGLRSTNIGLNQSYQELLMRYSNLVNQNNDIVNSSGDRQYNLQQELTTQRQELADREFRLNQMEREIQSRENRLRNLEQTYTNDVASRDQRILELQNEIFRRDQQLQQLKFNFDSGLQNTNTPGLSVTQQEGKIYLTLSDNLLFSSGSAFLGSSGRQAIRSIVNLLQKEKDVDISIEGHTDNQGDSRTNWKLSVDRAYSVAQTMLDLGVDPSRITVSGKGQYAPKTNNNTEAGRSQNRRTEIILIPKSENINNLLYRQ
ncbi:MAG: OmpA family protein [Bacteroidota bacterium]